MNVNRIRHLENALVHFEKSCSAESRSARSIDSHLRAYCKAHKSKLNVDDRQWLSDNFKEVYRWRGLLDHFAISCNNSATIPNRLRTYFGQEGWRSYTKSKAIDPHVRLSVPEVLYQKLVSQFGGPKAEEICSVYCETPRTCLRINPLVVESRDKVIKELVRKGISAEPTLKSVLGIVLGRTSQLSTLPELKDEHWFDFQDESAQLAVGPDVIDYPSEESNSSSPKPVHILDYCAGSGGKSMVMGAFLQGKGHLYLHDVNVNYLDQAKQKLRKGKIRNFTILKPSSLGSVAGKMDYVLVDAPSTGCGQYRRYPDRKWLFSEQLLDSVVEQQRNIFKQALEYLKPKGRIVYSVSSFLAEETKAQVEHFCASHSLFLVKEPIRSFPESHGKDGFFVAVLEKQ